MAARSMWTGKVQFNALVAIDVSIYKATDEYEGKVPLREVCECCNEPFTRVSTCPAGKRRLTEELVKSGDVDNTTRMVKAVEGPDGKFHPVDGETLAAINDAVNSEAIVVDRIVPYGAVPMECAVGTFYARAPRKGGDDEAVAALVKTLGETGEAAIGTWAHHGNERLVAIHPVGDVLHITELLYAQEVRDDSDFGQAVDAIPDEAVEQFSKLFDTFDLRTDEFDHDGYENRAVAMRDTAIKAALAGKKPKKREAPVVAAAPKGLIATLQAANAAGGKKVAKKSPAKKKAVAK